MFEMRLRISVEHSKMKKKENSTGEINLMYRCNRRPEIV